MCRHSGFLEQLHPESFENLQTWQEFGDGYDAGKQRLNATKIVPKYINTLFLWFWLLLFSQSGL